MLMKKLVTLILVLAGIVGSASATKLYVWLNSGTLYFPNDNARIMAHLWEGGTTTDVEMTKEIMYGYIWYSCELNGNTKAIIVRQNPSCGTSTSIDWDNGVWARTGDVTGLSTENTNYGELWYDDGSKTYGVYTGASTRPEWHGLCTRSSIDGWDGYTNNMDSDDNNTFTRTYTKSDITAKELSAGDKLYFKFKHVENVLVDESGTSKNTWTEIHPSADTELAFGNYTDITQQASGESNKTWFVYVPSYDYEKIVLTASYIKVDGDYKWQVSADAYVTKTVNGEYQYATLGCPVPLEIVEDNSVTAYPLTANASTGKITKGSAITTIPANEGALLENTTGSNKTIRAKVLASAGASASNDLHAYTGAGNITQPGSGSTYYILGVQDEHVGFYKVNTTSGNAMGANTAYLSVSGVLAREFFAFDDGETTGIEAAKASQKMNGEVFNLAGQRVAQPTKGLYIVNGKKVIMK